MKILLTAKKAFLVTIVFSMTVLLLPNYSKAEENPLPITNQPNTDTPLTENEELTLSQEYENIDDWINTIDPYVIVTEDGTFKLDPNTPTSITESYDWNALQEHINQLNSEIVTNNLQITEDKEIIDPSDNNFMTLVASTGVTKTKKHWWGYTRWLNNSDTKNAIKNLRNAGNISSTSYLFRYIGLPLAGFTSTVAGGYYKLIANRMEAHNKGKGVKLSVTWAAIFTVSSQ